MRKLILAAATAALSLTLTTTAFAFNPQPDPPGKIRAVFVPQNKLLIGSASAGTGAGRFSDADDNYCGTRVPGHLPGGPNVFHPIRGGAVGGRFSDADDNYCGTKVPGHWGGGPIRYNAQGFRNAHDAVMLNPQPLPPKAGGSRFER